MSDIFREVDEDVRQDKMVELWSKYSIVVAGLALAIVAATALFVWQRHVKQTQAEAAGLLYQAAQELSQKNRHEDAAAAFEELAKTAPAGYQLLARLRAAEEKGLTDAAGAVKELDLISGDEKSLRCGAISPACAPAPCASTTPTDPRSSSVSLP